jgi:hypothetical protein
VNRRALVVVTLLGAGIAGSLVWLRQGDGRTPRMKPSATMPKTDDGLYASRIAPAPLRYAPPLPAMSSAAPPVKSAPSAVAPQAEVQQRPSKPAPRGFAQGPLPTSPTLRSAPVSSASPKLREAYQARTSRAAILNRRLERHVAKLKAELDTAGASERTALEHDLNILTAQLEARRPWESRNTPTR